MDFSHGVIITVDELFFPDYDVACNVDWGRSEVRGQEWGWPDRRLRVFPANAARLEHARDITEVRVPRDVALRIVEIAADQDRLGSKVIDCGLLPGDPVWWTKWSGKWAAQHGAAAGAPQRGRR